MFAISSTNCESSFNFGNDFKYDLTHLGLFYRDYHRLMSHWKSVLPTRILDVDYEQLVADPRGETQAMLEFINLAWDEKCVRFHENKRPVATAKPNNPHSASKAATIFAAGLAGAIAPNPTVVRVCELKKKHCRNRDEAWFCHISAPGPSRK